MRNLSRRDFTQTISAGLGAAIIKPFPHLLVKEKRNDFLKKRPNIVFICSDQHGYKYTGFAGHPVVRTPNLDRIANKGVVFSQAYTGNPVCVAGRCSMMTGMFASDSNSFCNSTVWDGSHQVWGTHLKKEGYYCRAIGKMDLNTDFDTGFDEIKTSHEHRINPDITSLFRRPVAYRVDERSDVDGGTRTTRHGDSATIQLGLKFLQQESSNIKAPWAIYVGLVEPHPKFMALEKYYKMYPEYNIDMPNIPQGHLEDLHLVFQELRHFKRIATPIPEDRIRRARAAYYGMITEMDEYIGTIWDKLEQSGELKNTLFIYTSDHGESLGEHGLWLKNNLYDVASRIPLIIAGAGLPENIKIETPVAHVDLVATILDLAGSDVFNKLRGHSLLPILQGKSGSNPSFVFSESHSEGNCTSSYMIRKGDWKYIHFTWYDDLLFNVSQDPGEFNNLVNNSETSGIKAELKNILYSLIDPEDVTMRSFKVQEKMLADFAARMTEDQLFDLFKGRLGPGQARALAKKSKG